MKPKREKEVQETPEKIRVQFDFTKESLDKLDEIKELMNASTRAEVIRRVLMGYAEIKVAQQRGAKLYLREPDGTLIQIMPLF